MIQGEGGAQILVEPDLAEHFEAALTQVRTVPVVTRVIALSELRVAPPKKQSISSIEASLRLDAVASAGEGKLAALLGLWQHHDLRYDPYHCIQYAAALWVG